MHSTPVAPERFHALDATRAFALLLGVVFHAVWTFIPHPSGAPLVDASAHPVFDWFFFTAHTFRMQLFFLIAGFFAHLLYHRRGPAKFMSNRLLRIGLPLVVGWLILCPLVIICWVHGGNVSGGNIPPLPVPFLIQLMFEHGLIFKSSDVGGMFNLVHLWFMYYLICGYVLILVGRFLLTRSAMATALVQRQSDRFIRWVICSHGARMILVVGAAAVLWPMQGWNGVDTPLMTLVPSVPVLLFYGGFFLLGWMLHRQAGSLKLAVRHWRWYVTLGLLASFAPFLVYKGIVKRGWDGDLTNGYPMLSATHVTDWPALLRQLKAGEQPGAPIEVANLWRHLPVPVQAQITRLQGAAVKPDECVGISEALNKALVLPGLFTEAALAAGAPLPAAAQRQLLADNRLELERLFPNVVSGNPRQFDWFPAVKLGYAIGYSLVMWLLLFGTLGAFQELCSGHSRTWRYLADSSYWIYLAHLPLVAILQVWVGPLAVPALIKFPLMLGAAFVVLFSSYHYLVRSTIIGRLLNGQSHPFTAWPFSPSAVESVTPPLTSVEAPATTGS